MRFILLTAGLLASAAATPATASHLGHLTTPYASRGECEAAKAEFASDDRELLLELFPDYFYNLGDVTSFLTRAFTCELSQADDQWYITNHRAEVFASDWYQRRHD